jgi:fucose 4-O-acetylase-like acetyltransferase
MALCRPNVFGKLEPMNNQRESWVDYAKAIGIILVVYGHVARGLHNSQITMNEHFYKLADNFVYSFHMPLFFFLSGLYFVKSFDKRTTKEFVFSKIDTIVYPYILWSLIQGLTEATLSAYTNGTVTYAEVFVLLWQPRQQFWFLYALVLIFLFSAIIYRYVKINKTNTFLLMSFVLLISKSYIPWTLYTNYIFTYLIYFAAGMFFQEHNIKNQLDKASVAVCITLLFLTSQYLTLWQAELLNNVMVAASLLNSMISIGFVIVISLQLSKLKLVTLKLIGSSSMAIYLLHILTGSSARVVLQKISGITKYEIHLIIGMLAGVFAPILLVYLSKKIRLPFIESYPISNVFSFTAKNSRY